MATDKPSIFTKIIRRELPADILHEDEHCIAIKDIQPAAPVHFLVISKKEMISLADMRAGDVTLLGHMMQVIQRVCAKLQLDQAGYRVITNVGSDGGQSVLHLHFHVLGGRAMEWPPG